MRGACTRENAFAYAEIIRLTERFIPNSGCYLFLIVTLMVAWPITVNAQPAAAPPSATGSMVIHVEGSATEDLNDDVQSVVPKGTPVVAEEAFLQALREQKGPRPPLHASLDSSRNRLAFAPNAQRALDATSVQTGVFVYGHKNRGGKLVVSLLVVRAGHGAPLLNKDVVVAVNTSYPPRTRDGGATSGVDGRGGNPRRRR